MDEEHRDRTRMSQNCQKAITDVTVEDWAPNLTC